ncbi:MAG: hypothetical protein D6784_11520 [Chloroflexi bacterium]|nr:MAG: hypothetical protein D6784_11520 [Chloroflexota bacterium]
MQINPVKSWGISLEVSENRTAWPWAAWNWRTLVLAGGLLAVFVILLASIQFATPHLAGNDGYYHIKIAQVMRQQGLVPDFDWLPLTILNAESFYDHHFLYHVLLIPFTFGDLRTGAKWASVLFPALTFLTGWVLLRGQRTPYAALWSLGLMGVSSAFLYRMSMPRVQALSLLVLFLALHVTLTRRYRWLLPLSFLYVWLYDAFPLVLIVVGTYVGALWLVERKLTLRPLMYTAVGVVLGLVVNPYFPDNVIFIYHHLAPKLTDATATRVGNEWYPYKTWTLVENSGWALAAFLAGVFALGWQERRMNTTQATLLGLAVLFGAMLFKSRRFVEYFPAFALLFCAAAWSPLFQQWAKSRRWVGRELPVLLTLILIPAIWLNVQAAQDSLKQSKPYTLYAGASAWLVENTPAGSRVFQTDWDDFTRLFYYNTHNTYTLGLDPTYMQLYNPDLYDLWVDITRGRVEAPSQAIAEQFGGEYVITDLHHKSFLKKARNDPHLSEVYQDDDAVIFRVMFPPDDQP